MTRHRLPTAALAAVLAGAYLLLAVLSITCSFEHEPLHAVDHHHGSAVSHSSLCAWACQANPTSDVGPTTAMLEPVLHVVLLSEHGHVVLVGERAYHRASRAPPFVS